MQATPHRPEALGEDMDLGNGFKLRLHSAYDPGWMVGYLCREGSSTTVVIEGATAANILFSARELVKDLLTV